MTDETFILVYYALVACFVLSLIAAILVVLGTTKSRRVTKGRERGPAPSLQPGKVSVHDADQPPT